ncbi:hypothetical protein [Demequina sp.]|uniref:hypothetical protein n=1 Tax=Demequina sp. TaxID=2050685 RepID=UPI0025F5FB64|nr:hypothetical protein [Demequina sp.]
MRRWSKWFGLSMGGLLVIAGIAETVRLVATGDGGFGFWFGSLVVGGVLVIMGTVLLPRHPVAGFVLSSLGALAGILPTMWTIVVPLLLITLVVVNGMQVATRHARP